MPDRRIPRQPRQPRRSKHIRHVPISLSETIRPSSVTEAMPAHSCPRVLQGIQPEIHGVRGVLSVGDAEDTAFIVELVEHV